MSRLLPLRAEMQSLDKALIPKKQSGSTSQHLLKKPVSIGDIYLPTDSGATLQDQRKRSAIHRLKYA